MKRRFFFICVLKLKFIVIWRKIVFIKLQLPMTTRGFGPRLDKDSVT